MDDKSAILIVDDDELAARSLVRSLEKREPGLTFTIAASESAAQTLLADESFPVVVLDLSLDPVEGPESGLRLLEWIGERSPMRRVLVLTGHGSDDFGILALQRGAASFLIKPANPDHILPLILDALRFAKLHQQLQSALLRQEDPVNFLGLKSSSPKMRDVLKKALYAASNAQPVLLVGETGTGKGVVANAIHYASGRKGSFVRFQPGFGSADLVSSELFGHQRGAFTGATESRVGLIEEANRGTLFLDEVDELPPETQIALLNVLQERNFRRVGSTKILQSDFRLISATNRTLDDVFKERKLREDFYHRIAHITIEIPPLRDRREDIPTLANDFLQKIVERENLRVRAFSDKVWRKFSHYPFPGNVRELQANVESSALRANYHGRRIVEVEDLELPSQKTAGQSAISQNFRQRVESFERQLVLEALARNNNNQTKAAESLGMDRTSLRRILARAE